MPGVKSTDAGSWFTSRLAACAPIASELIYPEITASVLFVQHSSHEKSSTSAFQLGDLFRPHIIGGGGADSSDVHEPVSEEFLVCLAPPQQLFVFDKYFPQFKNYRRKPWSAPRPPAYESLVDLSNVLTCAG